MLSLEKAVCPAPGRGGCVQEHFHRVHQRHQRPRLRCGRTERGRSSELRPGLRGDGVGGVCGCTGAPVVRCSALVARSNSLFVSSSFPWLFQVHNALGAPEGCETWHRRELASGVEGHIGGSVVSHRWLAAAQRSTKKARKFLNLRIHPSHF
ncbi:none [Leptomonas seymouri]|uniref:None n=1 Tax=Leptomonas seymouri TaxID=5684 RepID=A0A0N0P2T1_LEPSE|nr:none [Leptomonas seymouri]|eukprot:KPI83319.1 none [Leptomonas seymouri]